MGWAEVKKTETSCKGDCGWKDVLLKIDDLLDDSTYEWAWDTLESIARWIKSKKHVTDKQKTAVNNIAKGSLSIPRWRGMEDYYGEEGAD